VIAAIVLAAGASSRMGRPKAELPLPNGHTVLSMGVSAIIAAGLPRIVVVAGAHPEAVRRALGTPDARVEVVVHTEWEQGQFSSFMAGFAHLDRPELEAVLVTLVDVPLVRPDTIRELVHAWRVSRRAIVRPARGAEHGHPVILDRAIFGEIQRADPDAGLKALVRSHEGTLLNVEVADEGAFTDLDTPEDYERLLHDGATRRCDTEVRHGGATRGCDT
jgi:CTP:molybdopterin cytidylyltransferase MocA